MIKKDIIVLGSTGSVGKQALEVVDFLNNSGSYYIRVVGLSANSNFRELEKQIRKYNPKYVALINQDSLDKLKNLLKDINNIKFFNGIDGICEILEIAQCDLVINAIVGISGLMPSITSLENGKTLALANKESLVVAGDIIMDIAEKNNTRILPVDSEHYAILKCISNNKSVKNLIITASGGAFYGKTRRELKSVTLNDALKHPTYKMGKKITIDSATLMNKALEIIEAYYLFGIDYDNIKVLIHPQSVVHSMVEFTDNSIIAQLSVPDMRLPLQSAITYPEIVESPLKELNLGQIGTLKFQEPNFETFPALDLAYKVGKFEKLAPLVLNTANEIAVNLFLNNKISFLEITELVKDQVDEYISHNKDNNQEINILKILETDKRIREKFGFMS